MQRESKREIELRTRFFENDYSADSKMHPVHRMEKMTEDVNQLVAEREEQARIRQMKEDELDKAARKKKGGVKEQRSATDKIQSAESQSGPSFVPSQKSNERTLKRAEEGDMEEDSWGSERRGSKMDRARSSGGKSDSSKAADQATASSTLINDADVLEQARIHAQEQLKASDASVGGAGSSTAVRHKQMMDLERKSLDATRDERTKQDWVEEWHKDEANQVDREHSTLRDQINRVMHSITGTTKGAHQPVQHAAPGIDRAAQSWTTHNIRTHGDVPTSMHVDQTLHVKTSPSGVGVVSHNDGFKNLDTEESGSIRGKVLGRLERIEDKIEDGLGAAKDKVGEWKDDVGEKWSEIKHKISRDDDGDKGKTDLKRSGINQWGDRGTVELPIPTGASIVGSNQPSATNNKGDKPGEAERVARIAAVHPRSQLDYKPAEMGGNLPPSQPIRDASRDLSLREKVDHKFRDIESDITASGVELRRKGRDVGDDIKQRGLQLKSDARDDLNKLSSKGREWKADLRDDAKSLEKRAAILKDDVKSSVSERVDDVKNKIGEIESDVKDKINDLEDDVKRGVDKIKSTFSNKKGDEMDPLREQISRGEERWSAADRTVEHPGLMQRVRSWWSPSTWRKAQVDAERTARKEATEDSVSVWHTGSGEGTNIKPDLPHPNRVTRWSLDNAANYSVSETAEAMQERLDELRRLEYGVPHLAKSKLAEAHEKNTLAGGIRSSLSGAWKEMKEAEHDWQDEADGASSSELDTAPSSPRSPLFMDKSRPQSFFGSMPHPSSFSPSLSDVSPSNGVPLHNHTYSRKFSALPSSTAPVLDISDVHFDEVGFGAIVEPW